MLSLIIPTLKTPDDFIENLESLMPFVDEMVIAAAVLEDKGVQKAKELGACVVHSKKGRGTQLRAGADAASKDWFLFLHADTILEEGWQKEVAEFVKYNPLPAAYFKFKLDHNTKQAKWLEEKVAWRCQKLALPYGDQGLLISKDYYNKIDGYADIPLMEDVDLVRKIGKTKLFAFQSAAITSADKFKGNYKLRSARNLFCLFLYFIKVPPRLIKKVYG